MKLPAIPAFSKNHDALLLTVAGVALALEMTLLFQQLRLISLDLWDGRSVGGRAAVGEVLRKARSVQQRAPGSLSWYPTAEGDSVSEEDTLMTGAQSTAVVRLQDGAELVLSPYTLIRFPREMANGGSGLALEVNRGSVKVRSRRDTVKFALREKSVAMQAQSEVLISAPSQAAKPELEVLSGTAQVSAGSEAVDLKAGQAADFTQAKPVLLTRFTPTSTSPAKGAQIFVPGDRASVRFEWQGEKAEALEWDFSAEMNSARRIAVDGARGEATFAPGKYYWRLVRAGAQSPIYEFAVLPEANYEMQMDSATNDGRAKEGKPVSLSWTPVSGAEGYELEVSSDAGFSKVERRLSTVAPAAQLPPLPKGRFYWRVRATHAYLGDWPFSKPQEIAVKKLIEAPKPKGVKILPEEVPKRGRQGRRGQWGALFFAVSAFAPSAQAAARAPETVALEFAWDASQGAKAYRLEVSTRKDFKTKLAVHDGQATSIKLTLPLEEVYFWRVAAIDEDGDRGPFSEPIAIRNVERTLAMSRKPNALPAAPSVPVKIVQRIEREAPEPPRDRSFRYWAGYGATYSRQSITGTGFAAQASGLPLNRILVGFSNDFELTTIEGHLWFQPLAYREGATTSYQALQWGGDLFWSRLALRQLFPLGLGVRVRSENVVSAPVGSSLGLSPTVFTALLVGTSWHSPGKFSWTGSAALEIAPFGLRRGIGLIHRNRFGTPWSFAGVRPSFEVVIHPQYRTQAAANEWNIEAGISLVLEWTTPLPTFSSPLL